MFPECYPCVLRQVLTTARLIDCSEECIIDLLETGMKNLMDNGRNILPQIFVHEIVKDMAQKKGVDKKIFDPYKNLKQQSNKTALAFEKHLETIIQNSENTLEASARIAGAGNIIDFGAKPHGDVDLNSELAHLQDVSFLHNDITLLEKKLSAAKKLLYICDNAGEIVMDKIFIKQILKQFPNIECTASVRGAPVINDATLDDAVECGLDKVVNVISSGSVYAGTIIKETTKEFQNKFYDADVVISKGQGNIETLFEISEKRPIFFILRVKCERMSALVESPVGSMILLHKPRKN